MSASRRPDDHFRPMLYRKVLTRCAPKPLSEGWRSGVAIIGRVTLYSYKERSPEERKIIGLFHVKPDSRGR